MEELVIRCFICDALLLEGPDLIPILARDPDMLGVCTRCWQEHKPAVGGRPFIITDAGPGDPLDSPADAASAQHRQVVAQIRGE